MQYAEYKNIPGLLLLIDFEKAFDTVSRKLIEHVLKNFNFGQDIQKWVNLFQNNIFSIVNQGGEFFQIKSIYIVAVVKGTRFLPIFLFSVSKY